jgi:hypothetical protein
MINACADLLLQPNFVQLLKEQSKLNQEDFKSDGLEGKLTIPNFISDLPKFDKTIDYCKLAQKSQQSLEYLSRDLNQVSRNLLCSLENVLNRQHRSP